MKFTFNTVKSLFNNALCGGIFLSLLSNYTAFGQTNTLPNTGNVGIGTTSPTSKLQVNGSARIDSSLVVKDSVIIQKKLKVQQDVKFQSDLVVAGMTKINGDLKLTNLSIANNFTDLDFLVANQNGLVKKASGEDLSNALKTIVYAPVVNPPIDICDLAGYTDNPTWSNGPSKIFSLCPEVKVGIGTNTPTRGIHVTTNGLIPELEVPSRLTVGTTGINTFSKLYVKNSTSTAGIYINQTGNNQTYSKLLFLEYTEPTTEIMKVSNTSLNYNPFILNANGSMYIRNNQGKTYDFDQDGRFTIYNNGLQTFRVETSGLIRGRRMKLDLDTWADYVFEPTYLLMPLNQLETYIKTEKHLPNVPSESELVNQGADVMELNKILMEKIEELTLYLIQQNKNMEGLQLEIEALKAKLEQVQPTK